LQDQPETPSDTPSAELCQTPAARPAGRKQIVALAALMTGAIGIGSSGIFVRLSETGPTATAFWRGALALPFLALWALLEARRSAARVEAARAHRRPPRFDVRLLWAGIFFAGDLGLWHWSLLETSIGASTLEANLAPIVVTLIAWIAWRERPSPRFLAALACAAAGVLLVMSPKLGGGAVHGALGGAAASLHARPGMQAAPGRLRGVSGDLLGLGTACFYAGYLVVVSRLRATRGAGSVMLWVTLVFTALLLPIALTQRFLPHTLTGWAYLVGLALIAQFFGQGLIAYALAQLPATFGSVGLYVQPIAAALYAWLLLGETLSPIQIGGAAVVLAAIALARPAQGAALAGRAAVH
jgi:drug/metabolite transporter (DMT)-like permease